jgi:hypothetical protein
MLTSDERAALVAYCNDHPVAICPQCEAVLSAKRLGSEFILGQPTVCRICRADLTPSLRSHLAECTWVRIQAQESRKRAG